MDPAASGPERHLHVRALGVVSHLPYLSYLDSFHPHSLAPSIMANDDEDRKASWSSWFAPGDTRQTPNQDNDVKPSPPAVSSFQAQETPQSETNPLIFFKHFVDDAFSAVTNFHKNVSDVQEALEDEHDKAYKRWTGADNTHLLIQIQGAWAKCTKAHVGVMGRPSNEARATARMLLLESARRNSHVDPSKITALFEDPEGDYPQWLGVEWFKSSPDSPVNLEADPALAKYDTKWRHAFEDLLEAALDKPMTSREKSGYRGSIGPTSTWRGPGLDWMLSLQCRGILPPQLPTMYSNATAASELFAREGLSNTMLGRWCQQHSPASEPELWERVRIKSEYTELLEAIETPAPEDTTWVYDKLEALGLPFKPVNTSMGECPDGLGRAVSGAIKSSHEPDTELDIYEQMYNDWLQDSEHQSDESEHSVTGARCPDELGRAVGDAARQEAARAFADEENGLNDCDAGVVADHTPDETTTASHALRDYQMQLRPLDEQSEKRRAMARAESFAHESEGSKSEARCPDELGRAVGDAARQRAARAFADEENGLVDCDAGVAADDTSSGNVALLDYLMQLKQLDEQNKRWATVRAESSANEQRLADREAAVMARLEQRLAEWKQLHHVLDATDWHKRPSNNSEKSSALNGCTSSKPESIREVERLVERCETLQRDQDSVKGEHRFYIDQLAEQLHALQDEHEELAVELADALERLEHKSHLLDQKDRQPSLAHPQNLAPAQADTSRPQVLSTLTTTETTRLPDGSVKTTVVLKRRFAGGLEETQESTQTSFEEPIAPTSGGHEPSRKGWFWS